MNHMIIHGGFIKLIGSYMGFCNSEKSVPELANLHALGDANCLIRHDVAEDRECGFGDPGPFLANLLYAAQIYHVQQQIRVIVPFLENAYLLLLTTLL